MPKTLLTLQDCERKFDEKFFDPQSSGYFVDGKIVPAGKHARQQKFLRSSFIQLLQSQIEEWKGMMKEIVDLSILDYEARAVNGVTNGGFNSCLQSLINSNEEVISKLK